MESASDTMMALVLLVVALAILVGSAIFAPKLLVMIVVAMTFAYIAFMLILTSRSPS